MKRAGRIVAAALLLSMVPAVANAQVDPNYHWKTDPVSKVMAGKPFADRVLNRVPGSFFDANPVNPAARAAVGRGTSLYGPGTPIYVGQFGMCTVTAAGWDAAGRKIALTAGHCGNVGELVAAADSLEAGYSGRIVRKNGALDYAVIELGPNAEVTGSYNGTTIRSLGGWAKTGDTLCKNGYATGVTCGVVWASEPARHVTQVCAMAGDSGAPVYAGDRLVGMINGGMLPQPVNLSCHTPLQGGLHAPTVSRNIDAVMRDLNAAPGPGQGFRLA
ncbi:S1 family peptidase [Corynebacterium tuscaniense]|uniref:S1 family peptidase n=1 Tax=Corynebacterium tuscaniense TaxID=302449 RepID=UPI00050E3D56|nr:S1 family peptidase [Corynebacterium tuscaniense]KGF21925.1 trypsin [Corynebacterium tuscaniense DNF00037]